MENESKNLFRGLNLFKIHYGLITGGTNYTASINVFFQYVKEFTKNGIDFSVLWGTSNNWINLYYTAKKRTVLDQNNNTVLELEPDSWVVSNCHAINEPSDLSKVFEVIKISPNDKLIIDGYNNNRPVDRSEIPSKRANLIDYALNK